MTPAAADNVVLSGLARALVQHQLLRLDQAVALQRRADASQAKFVDELVAVQGSPAEIGGYYKVDAAKTDAVMRPSATFTAALAAL